MAADVTKNEGDDGYKKRGQRPPTCCRMVVKFARARRGTCGLAPSRKHRGQWPDTSRATFRRVLEERGAWLHVRGGLKLDPPRYQTTGSCAF